MQMKLAALGALLVMFYATSVSAGIKEALDKGDYTKALEEVRPLAHQGNAAAQNILGVMYENGEGVSQDYRQGMEWIRKAAEQGFAKAQKNLGNLYYLGNGVAQDYAQAMLWYRKAAAQGDAEAQHNLGIMYANGQGVARDDAQAMLWISKAAHQGFAAAQSNLGAMYANGQGVARDDAQAMLWISKAAHQGYAEAQHNLGAMYLNGEGVSKDEKQAGEWLRKAADQGDSDSQRALGDMYTNGIGVPKDGKQAMLWYRKAAAQGDAEAQNILIAERDNQSYFEHIRTSKVKSYNNAINEIQKSAIFNKANAETSAFISSNGAHFSGWLGKISAITTSHGGKDVFIAIDSPWGAAYEINENAPLGSQIYQRVSTLKEGQRVKFTGALIPADDDPNHWERSITEIGSLLNPEFRVVFDNLEPAQTTGKHNP